MSGWTPENIERVKALAEGGFSAAQIAAAIGGVSRNAVVGVGHRQGIRFHGNPGLRVGTSRASRAPQSETAPTKSRLSIVNELLRKPQTETEVERFMLTFDELNRGDCKYPFGDSDFRFCGLPAIEGQPYCQHCSRLAYQSPEHRR
jgi:GcrA cell cycle regulator